MRLLYVEDSKTLRETVARGLRKAGFTVDVAADGSEGLDAAMASVYDVVILDVMMPEMDGFEVLQEMRKADIDSEVLMLTARIAIEDRVAGLESGANDYLVKPFAFDELLARVRALVRRRYNNQSSSIEIGPLTIDVGARMATFADREVALRPREFDILEYLALRKGETVSRIDIHDHIYDHAAELKSNAIDAAVCVLRKKLADAGVPELIATVPRRGYRLAEPVSTAKSAATNPSGS